MPSSADPRAASSSPVHHAGSLTLFQGAALYLGAVLGTGVIALPALAAEVAGPASLLAWAVLVVLSAPLAATFAALGARGIGGHAQVLAAAAALLLTLGTMNAYFAGAAKLGAALGRDGALPAWLAQGSQIGGVPRRSLGVVAALAALAMVATTVADVGPKPLVLVTSGCFVMVYGLGAAAALKLLPRGGIARRCAWVSLVAVAGLFLTTGWYFVWPALLAGGALLYLRVAARGGSLRPAPARSSGACRAPRPRSRASSA